MNQKEAAQQGLKLYSTGAPCVRGHLAQRYTSTGACVECLRSSVKKRRQEIHDVWAGKSLSVTFSGTPEQIASMRAYWKMIGGEDVPAVQPDLKPPQDPLWFYHRWVANFGQAVADQMMRDRQNADASVK